MRRKSFYVVMAALIGIFLAGCATTTSRTALYEKGKEQYSIYAVGDTGNFSTTITVFVNGEAVAKGSTTSIKPVANFSGTYKNIKVDAECKSVATGSMLSRQCTIYMGGAKAAELSF
jgi:hypothetical protein